MPRIEKTNTNDLAWAPKQSPSGQFSLQQQDVSLALGGKKDRGVEAGGHPFDVSRVRLAAGKRNWPLHAHSNQWECFLITAGTGRWRTLDEADVEREQAVGPGDCLLCPPGLAHCLRAGSDAPLEYWLIATNQPSDSTHYPDSGKFFLKPQRVMLRGEATADYWDGEDEA
ncbi:MAG: cupin domain-containing protein [Opitutales bacterium]